MEQAMEQLVRCKMDRLPIKQEIARAMELCKRAGLTPNRKSIKKIITSERMTVSYRNGTYTVLFRDGRLADEFIHENALDDWAGQCAYISVRRNDREPVDSWRDLQEIKNQLCGPEREAVQLYPAESRLVDCANQYHLWVLPEGVHFPMGFFSPRVVADNSITEGTRAKQSNREITGL